jgi:DNA primase
MADEETLRASGLFSSKEQGRRRPGPIYDRFRKRVMFPICNEGGRVIAFTARTLETGEKAGREVHQLAGDAALFEGPGAVQPGQGEGGDPAVEFALLVEGQMDCISVFLRGIQNVIATSGTAFTEQQVAILKRHTSNVVVNFDPDAAGANAAEKSIALLTEEGFAIKIVTLDGGLDPTGSSASGAWRPIRRQLRGARRQSDYLIERARQLVSRRERGAEGEGDELSAAAHPAHAGEAGARPVCRGRGAEAGHRLGGAARGAAAGGAEAAGPCGSAAAALTEVERVLLRALAITDPETRARARLAEEAFKAARRGLSIWRSFPAMQALAGAQANDPMDVVEDPAQRALLAEALLGESKPPGGERGGERDAGGSGAGHGGPAAGPAGADCRGRAPRRFAGLAVLTQQKLELDRRCGGCTARSRDGIGFTARPGKAGCVKSCVEKALSSV